MHSKWNWMKFLDQNREKNAIFQKPLTKFQMPIKTDLQFWRVRYKFLKCSLAFELSNALRIWAIRWVEVNLHPLVWLCSDFPKKIGKNEWEVVQESAKMGLLVAGGPAECVLRTRLRRACCRKRSPRSGLSNGNNITSIGWVEHKIFRILRKNWWKNSLWDGISISSFQFQK